MIFSFAITLCSAWVLGALSFAQSAENPDVTAIEWGDISNASVSAPFLDARDDPRFSTQIIYGHTDLPLVPILMNAVDLTAQYATMTFFGRAKTRYGPVLPGFPEVEIAVIPARPATSVEVRLVIWTIYCTMVDMILRKMFKEMEVEIKWEEKTVGYVYFTKPKESSTMSDESRGFSLPSLQSTAEPSGLANMSASQSYVESGQFSWLPSFRPEGKSLSQRDVFVLTIGILKAVARFSMADKVEGPFHVGSEIVDAHLEVQPQGRRTPQTRPPYFQYDHIVETVRRIPGWMLSKKKFAEFGGFIIVNDRPVGQLYLLKGPFRPESKAPDVNISSS
ncbi:hypothetical protein ACLMJK_006234 [Lecanora helva]